MPLVTTLTSIVNDVRKCSTLTKFWTLKHPQTHIYALKHTYQKHV